MGRVALVITVIATDHSRLQAHHHIGVISMVFTTMHVFEQATLIQGFAPAACTAGHLPLIFFELIKGDATNSGGHASKGDLDQFSVESHCLE